MPLETSARKQKAVLWAANGTDNYGRMKVDSAVEIDVRWEIKQKEVLDPQGEIVLSEALVVVDRDIAVGSILWFGRLVDAPSPTSDLKQVINFNKIPDVKGRNFRREVLLVRFNDTLPTVNG